MPVKNSTYNGCSRRGSRVSPRMGKRGHKRKGLFGWWLLTRLHGAQIISTPDVRLRAGDIVYITVQVVLLCGLLSLVMIAILHLLYQV